MNKRLLLALVLGAAASAFAQENYTTWTKYKVLTLTPQSSLSGTVDSFPLLVRLDATNFTGEFANGGTDGASIRFTDSTGTVRLAHQRERWDAAGQKAEFWVKVPRVLAGTAGTKIRMYWSKAAAADSSRGAQVFGPGNGFVSRWPLGDSAGTGRGNSVAGAPSGLLKNFGTYTAPDGIIGKADKFAGGAGEAITGPGTRPWIDLNPTRASYAGFNTFIPGFTYSFWMKDSVFVGGARYLQLAADSTAPANSRLLVYRPANPPSNNMATRIGATNGTQETNDSTILTGSWFHIQLSKPNGSDSIRVYINGKAARRGIPGSGAGFSDAAPRVYAEIGRSSSNVDGYLAGTMDEVQMSSVARDSNWAKLSFQTQCVAGVTTCPATAPLSLGATQIQGLSELRYVGAPTGPADTLALALNEAVNIVPTFAGTGPLDSVRIIGTATLPTGITFNGTTGALTGTPTATFAAANRTIRAYKGADTTSRVVRVSAAVLPAAFTITKYTQDTVTYTLGQPVGNGANYTGRHPTGYSVTPQLPAGLQLNAVTGLISGAPTAAVAATNYTVKGFNSRDTSTRNVRITTSGTAENYTQWTRHRSIWLNTGGANTNGAAISGTVLNFPVLVRIPAGDTVLTQALTGGADLRFSKANGTTPLPYQIESWSTTQGAAVWVLVDTVLANNTTQTIQMHWTRAGSTSQSSGAAVFRDFQAVMHMNAGGTGDETDASPRAAVATATGTPADSAGLIGRARFLNGTSQYFQIANSWSGPLNLHLTHSYSLSAWVKLATVTATAGDGHKIIDKGDNQYVLAVYGNTAAAPQDDGFHFWEITTRGNNQWNQCTSNPLTTAATACTGPGPIITAESSVGKWTHVVGVYQGAPQGGAVAESLYVDGNLVSTRTFTHTNTTGRNETFNVSLGVQIAGTAPAGTDLTRYLNGTLDEVRVSTVLRGVDWNKLEFANQRAGQNFTRFAVPTAIAPGAGPSARAGFSVKPAGRGLLFQLQGAHAGRAALSLMDMSGRTVWSGAFSGKTLEWDGRSVTGSEASSGVYAARLTLLDQQGKAVQVMDRKVPFTR